MMIAIERPTIREASARDADNIRDLLSDIGLGAECILVATSRYWVAEDTHGAVIGTIGLELGQGVALLRSAGVHPHWRGHGLGTLLVRLALRHARTHGCTSVFVFSADAGSYWQRCGFREVPVDELVAALPDAPQAQLYDRKGWLLSEVAWRIDV